QRTLGNLLAENAIRANHLLPPESAPRFALGIRRVVYDKQVIAHGVVGVLVAPAQLGLEARDGRHLLVEDLIAQALSKADVAATAGQPDFKAADLSVDFVRLAYGEGYATAIT